jgi:tetratricopeptide (TPR) repeat protein
MPALNKISQTAPDALTLLRVLCFCDPENIPISILKQGCCDLYQDNMRDVPVASAVNELKAIIDLFRSSIRLAKAIQEIQRLSLAVYTLEGSERIIRIHDLVQLLLQSKLIATAERKHWLEMVICIFSKASKGIGDPESPRNWARWDQFISHIEFMEGFAAQYGLLNATLLDASTRAAAYVHACGLYEKAANMRKRTWDQRKALLGEEHSDTLASMANLALTYQNQGRWTEAEKLGIRVSETRQRVLGEEHPETLISIGNLASTYQNQGRWTEAEKLEIRVSETRQRVLGEEHPNTLSSMGNLASTCYGQGRWKEAEELIMRVLETSQRVLGKEHPHTLVRMNILAFTWKAQGRNAKAINLLEQCIHLRSQIIGADHPSTVSSSAALTQWQRENLETGAALHTF